MSTIVLRSVKGTPLTNTEVDANFSNLNTDKIQIGGTYSSGTANGVLYLNGSKVLTSGSALTFDGSVFQTSLGTGLVTNTKQLVLNNFSGEGVGITFSRPTDSTEVNAIGTASSSWELGLFGREGIVFAIGGGSTYSATSEAMRLTSTGLGIGTNSPSAKLQIRDGSTEDVSGSAIRMDLSGINPYWEIQGLNGGTSANRKLNFYTSALGGQSVLTLTQAGNVGIGASSLVSRLTVKASGGTYATGSLALVGSSSGTSYITNAGGTLYVSNDGSTDQLVLNSAGNLGIGTNLPLGKLDVRGTAYFNGTGATGGASQLMAAFGASGGSNFGQLINTNTTWSLGYGASYSSVGTSVLTWDASGNVGIGTGSPSTFGKLAVYGNGTAPVIGAFLGSNSPSSGATLADIAFGSRTDGTVTALIRAIANDNGNGTDGQLTFWTADNTAGAGNLTKAATLDSAGNLLVGTTTNTNSSKLVVNGTISQTVSGTQYQVVDQSDIGTAPNEIPLNQYLGSLAYQNGDAYYNTGMTVGFRNRIINGNMAIAQRGYATTSNPGLGYASIGTLDRWGFWCSSNAAFTTAQVSDAPSGFVYSTLITTVNPITFDTSTYGTFSQRIEGNNIADLAWGTANAKPITISFWVKSSLTGTFSAYVFNDGYTYNYPFTFNISTANTWVQITKTIAGPTVGTWQTDTRVGIEFGITLMNGTNYSAPADAWISGNYRIGSPNSVNLLSTSGATMNVTGVQLEKGNIATSFDVRPYGTELALCQRYCWVSYTTNGNGGPLGTGAVYSSTLTQVAMQLPVPMRTTPSATTVLNGSSVWCQSYIGATGTTTATTPSIQTDQNNFQNIRLAVDGLSGMTAGQASWTFTAANAKLILSAEL